jgi:hypothetical protein
MFHPLAPDLSTLTNDELHSKFNELNNRFTQAHRAGSMAVLGQMRMLLDDYRAEISRRQQKILDDATQKNSDFKNIIDIK